MSEIKRLLGQRVDELNRDKKALEAIGEWLRGYEGKIVCLKAEGETYHLVFSGGGVKLREGDYPSCEVWYRGDQEGILRIIKGEDTASTAVTAKLLKVWGNLNDARRFERIFQPPSS